MTFLVSFSAWYPTTAAMIRATVGSSQYSSPVARMTAALTATPPAAAASAAVLAHRLQVQSITIVDIIIEVSGEDHGTDEPHERRDGAHDQDRKPLH